MEKARVDLSRAYDGGIDDVCDALGGLWGSREVKEGRFFAFILTSAYGMIEVTRTGRPSSRRPFPMYVGRMAARAAPPGR